MAIPEKKPYERLSDYLERSLPAELEAGKSRGKATADIIAKFNEEPPREMFAPFIWGAANASGSAGGGGGDVDADAYIAAVITAGGTLSAGDEAAIQTLYTDLKSNSLYTKLQLFYPMMGGIAASTAINGNLNTNFDITWNGSLTFNSNGVTGTGTNGDYGNTNFTPSIDGGGNDFSYGIYTTAGNFDQEKYMFGALGNGFLDIPRGDSVNQVGIYGWSASQRQAMTFTRGDGQYTGTFDTTSGEKTLYFNADVVGYPSTTSTPGGGFGRANQDVFLFTLNLNGSPYTNNYWDGSCRFFYYGDYLTQSEVETINTVIQTFQTSLGRNTY